MLLICFDRISKVLAQNQLKNNSERIVLNHVFSFYYLENTGAAFGILNRHPWVFILLSILIFIAVLIIFCRITACLRKYSFLDEADFRKRTYHSMVLLCYILIVLMAGAAGNLIDRILHGYVIDFIRLLFINFPVFNLADIYITVSTVFLVIFFIFIYKEDRNFHFIK